MGRINLRVSEDLHEAAAREAAKAGITLAAYAREALAWRLGRAEMQHELAELRARLERVERRLDDGQ